MVLNPPDSFDNEKNLILPGPLCLKYLWSLQHRSSGYRWPTDCLAACMSDPGRVPSMHWLVDTKGEKITCESSRIFSAD